jgi:hypothetical protein
MATMALYFLGTLRRRRCTIVCCIYCHLDEHSQVSLVVRRLEILLPYSPAQVSCEPRILQIGEPIEIRQGSRISEKRFEACVPVVIILLSQHTAVRPPSPPPFLPICAHRTSYFSLAQTIEK